MNRFYMTTMMRRSLFQRNVSLVSKRYFTFSTLKKPEGPDMSCKVHKIGKYSTYVQTPGDGSMRTVTMLPGDGIGPELCESVRRVFSAAGVPIKWEVLKSKECITKEGTPSEKMLESLRRNKIGLKGVFLTKHGPEGPRSINVQLRQELELYAFLTRSFNVPGHKTRHDNVDITLIRENTEGEYSGMEHEVVPGVVESLKMISRNRCESIAEYAFEYATLNGRKKVTAVHKANIMKKADGLFLDCVREVSEKYPRIHYEEVIVDNCCMQMVSNPQQFDVMVLPNLYGNIVGNISSALVGGPGLTPGANVGRDVAIFEQGARHVGEDIAGQDRVNPAAFLFSAVMMLRHMSLPAFADMIENAVLCTIEDRKHITADLGGKCSTTTFVTAVNDRIRECE
eukprot:151018_1